MAQVAQHQLLGAGNVTTGNGIDDLGMFVGAAACRGRRVVQIDDQASQARQLTHAARQRRVAGQFGQQVVEFAGQAHDGAIVAATARVDLQRQMLAQPSHAFGRQVPDQPTQQGRLNQAPRFENVVSLFDRRLGHISAALRE